MKLVNSTGPDLNLLRVFLTIYELRNLTLAGERLGLTQSAVSHALRRLRVMFDDPLFVRAAHSMVPTETANRLSAPLAGALSNIQQTLKSHGSFDPGNAERTFRLAMSDVSEFSFLLPLVSHLERIAPQVRLEIVPLDAANVAAAMRAGEIDLTVGFVPGLEEGFASHTLFSDSFTCIVRAGHAMAGRRLTHETLALLDYIYATSNASGHRLIEQWLSDIGVKRRIVLRLANITIAPAVVRGTDLAVIFPRSVARQINKDGAFSLLPLPPGHPMVEIMIHVYSRFSADRGIQWMLDVILGLFRAGPDGAVPAFPRAGRVGKRG